MLFVGNVNRFGVDSVVLIVLSFVMVCVDVFLYNLFNLFGVDDGLVKLNMLFWIIFFSVVVLIRFE